jgi:uncharacterized membrane protein
MNKIKIWFNKTENTFLIISGLFGLISIFMNPILVVPDESTHLAFSYSMFSCNAHVPKFVNVYDDHQNIADSIRENNYIQYFTKKVNLDSNCFTVNIKEKKSNIVYGNNTAVTGSIVKHFANFPAAIGVLIGREVWPTEGGIVLLGRLTNFALFIAVVYFILKKVKFGKLVFLFIAITPMVIQQMASLSYDVLNLIAIFAFVAFCINLAVQKSKPSKNQYIQSIGIVLLLSVSKPNNLLMIPLLLAIIAEKYHHPQLLNIKNFINSIKQRWGTTKYRTVTISTILVITAFILYMLSELISVQRLIATVLNTVLYINVNGQLDPIATTGVVGNFGWLTYRFPEWIVILWFVVLTIVLLGYKAPKLSRRLSFWALATFLLLCASVFGAIGYDQYIHGSNVLLGVQGRYFTPLLTLLILVFAGLRQDIKIQIRSQTLQNIAVLFSLIILLLYVWLTKLYYYS